MLKFTCSFDKLSSKLKPFRKCSVFHGSFVGRRVTNSVKVFNVLSSNGHCVSGTMTAVSSLSSSGNPASASSPNPCIWSCKKKYRGTTTLTGVHDFVNVLVDDTDNQNSFFYTSESCSKYWLAIVPRSCSICCIPIMNCCSGLLLFAVRIL